MNSAYTIILTRSTDEQERPLFQASREEFAAMAITPSESPELKRTLPVPDAALSIIKPCFERGLKWEVVYLGNKIFVAVTDEAFLTRVDNGEESFAKGDVLEVEMHIEQVFDAALNTYINKSHEIIRVKNHRPRARQMSIDLSPDSPAPKMLNPQQNES